MSLKNFAFAAAAASLAFAALPASAQEATIYGVWSNPKGSVRVDIQPCGPKACGTVVWANDHAKEDARKGGTQKLVGLQVFRDLARDNNGVWRGKVFAPDVNMTFSGQAKLRDPQSLSAKGCVIAGLLCKSQVWKRIS